jgi:hypothetical protein
MLASLGAGGNREVKNRSLGFDSFSSMLSNMLGQPGERRVWSSVRLQ